MAIDENITSLLQIPFMTSDDYNEEYKEEEVKLERGMISYHDAKNIYSGCSMGVSVCNGSSPSMMRRSIIANSKSPAEKRESLKFMPKFIGTRGQSGGLQV
jgi:hypothetical protein